MRADVAKDLTDSAGDFTRLVWPQIKVWCRGGELISVESTDAKGLSQAFDTMAGVDAWQVCYETQSIRGVASRIQYGSPWASFTIRETRASGTVTELKKRMAAMSDLKAGWLVPALTVQAYISNRVLGDLLHVAMVRTFDLYDYIASGTEGRDFERRVNPQDKNSFLVVWEADLRQAGISVKSLSANHVRVNKRSLRQAA